MADYFFLALHIWAEDFWDCYRAVFSLVEFKDWYQDSGTGDDGVVQGMAEDVPFGLRVFVA